MQYYTGNYEKNLTLCGLAAYFHMSEGQFCRFFKSQIGMTAIEYLNYYRIGVACDMLKEGICQSVRLRQNAATITLATLTGHLEGTCTVHQESIG